MTIVVTLIEFERLKMSMNHCEGCDYVSCKPFPGHASPR